jgi:hypothetical protein
MVFDFAWQLGLFPALWPRPTKIGRKYEENRIYAKREEGKSSK